TVYAYPHIGNWFTFVRYDLLVRTLRASGYEPRWVMNITDVGHLVSDGDEGEDKLEKGARREGKSAWDVAKFYTDYFVQGLERMNIAAPTYLPKATEHIQEQIDLIKRLEERGFTYTISDGVYYDTAKFPRYADFARLDVDEQQAGKRVEFNPEKRNVSDFALWKFSPKDQIRDMEWNSPWGKGFPGWHLECSAMSMKYLGETMDVHAGGIDHVPVHHTNEIAQTEAVTGKPMAQCWMHTNHITVNGEKISKSLGNGITLEDIEKQGFSLMALRLHVLESHYRSQSKFSWESLAAASNRLKDYRAMADLRFQPATSESNELTELDYDQYQQDILAALQDDLDTPTALSILSRVSGERTSSISAHEQPAFERFLQFIDDALGLQLLASSDATSEQKQLIAQRQTARDNKEWQTSDNLRNELGKQGIGIRDTEYGSIWYRL
ncbi:MAG TPA: cysteine--tRNA ligase, partial [Candidatus Saccharimonadales bacterium]